MSDELESASSVEDTAGAAPESASSAMVADQAPSAEPTQDTPTTNAPADKAVSAKATGSLKSPKAAAKPQPNQPVPGSSPGANKQQATPAPQQPDVNWQERYQHLQADRDRKLAQAKQEREQFTKELNDHRAYRQKQTEDAQRAQLKPFNKRHPENSATMTRVGRAESFTAALQAASPEQQNDPAYRGRLAQSLGVTNDDLKLADEYKAHRESTIREYAADPDGFVEQRAQQVARTMFEQMWQQKQVDHQAQQDVQGMFYSDPAIKGFVQEHAAEVHQAIEAGVPPEYAVHQIKMFQGLQQRDQTIAALQAQLQGLTKNAGMVSEQQRLAQSRATLTRDPAPVRSVDAYALAKKWAESNGVSKSSPAYYQKIAELSKAVQSD